MKMENKTMIFFTSRGREKHQEKAEERVERTGQIKTQ